MKGILDGQTVSIPCANCGHKTAKTIGWLKTNSKLTCTCGTVIDIDASQFRREVAKTDRALADFKRKLQSLGKRK